MKKTSWIFALLLTLVLCSPSMGSGINWVGVPQTYPGSGIPVSTGSAWDTSISKGTLTDGKWCSFATVGGLSCTQNTPQSSLSLLKGTYNDGYWCKYTATGTLLDCTVNPADYSPVAGSSSITTVGTLSSGNATAVVDAASDSAAGIVELATDAETGTGSATDKVLTPSNLAAVYQYQTLYIPASAMTPAKTNGAAAGKAETSSNKLNMDYLAFDGATEEMAHFQLAMPEGWDRSTIKAKFFWSSATSSTAGDTVEWELACVAISDNDALDAAVGTSQVISDTLLADNGGDLQVSGATPALTVGGTPALADMVHCRVCRNVGGTDDMGEDAWLFGAWVQFKVTNTVAAW